MWTAAFIYWGKYKEVGPPGHREGECVGLLDAAGGFPEGRTTSSRALQPPPGWPPPSPPDTSHLSPRESGQASPLLAFPAAPASRGKVQTQQHRRALHHWPCVSPQLYLWFPPTLNLTFQPYRRPTVPCTHVTSVLLHTLSFPLGACNPLLSSWGPPPCLLRSNESISLTC